MEHIDLLRPGEPPEFGAPDSQSDFALALGAGVIVPFTRHWGLETATDYLNTRDRDDSARGPLFSTNAIRTSAGLAFRFNWP